MWFGGFLGVLRPNIWFVFDIDLFIVLFTVPDVNQGLSLIMPLGDFPGDSDVVPFQDAIHGKYLIEIPKLYVILLRIERRTRLWRFLFETVNSF